MKVLLDACVPRLLHRFLSDHIVQTAQEMGWAQLKNGDLIRQTESQFEVLITSDKNLKYQQNPTGRRIAILVVPTNNWPALRNMTDEIVASLETLFSGRISGASE
jgi:hypothetical protein